MADSIRRLDMLATNWFPIPLFAILVAFAILFGQSGLDKVFDRSGNLAWMEPHFEKSPLRNAVKPLLTILTCFEVVSGVLCATAAVLVAPAAWMGLPIHGTLQQQQATTVPTNWVIWAMVAVLVTLLQLFLGQRLAKDYVGAASLAPYFVLAVALSFCLVFVAN